MTKSKMQNIKRLSDVDHVLLRPDTYGGVYTQWNGKIRMYQQAEDTIWVIPMMYKMFDECLVNARDNISRGKLLKLMLILT